MTGRGMAVDLEELAERVESGGALVARLESLSTEERRKHGVPQDIAMHEAATALRTLARERDEANAAREGYYDAATLLIEKAETRASSLEAQLAGAKEALVECEEYFDNRADADCDQDGFIPNKEMRLLTTVREALASAPASAPVVSHEQASGETQAGLLLTDETQAECEFCAGTGYFYSEPELGPCACPSPEGRDGKEACTMCEGTGWAYSELDERTEECPHCTTPEASHDR